MKNFLVAVIIGFVFLSGVLGGYFGCSILAETSRQPFEIHVKCIDGYKFVIIHENGKVAITQMFETSSYMIKKRIDWPPQPIKCKEDK